MDNRTKLKLILLVLLLFWNNHAKIKLGIKKNATEFVKSDSEKSGIKANKYQPDSLEISYMKYQFYFKTYVRLLPHRNAFIFIDSTYVVRYIKDKKIQRLFLKTKSLNSHNRESYYKKIMKGIPKSHIKMHLKVWNLKEVRECAKGFDGGYHSVVTVLDPPNESNRNFFISIKRDYYEWLRATSPIARLEIDPKNHIFIYDQNEDLLPLKKWRSYSVKKTEHH